MRLVPLCTCTRYTNQCVASTGMYAVDFLWLDLGVATTEHKGCLGSWEQQEVEPVLGLGLNADI